MWKETARIPMTGETGRAYIVVEYTRFTEHKPLSGKVKHLPGSKNWLFGFER